jgi:Lon protease-like protein
VRSVLKRAAGSAILRRVDAADAGLWSRKLSRVGLFPLPNVVLFPCQSLALHVFEPRYRRLIRDAIAQHSPIAVPRLKPGFDADYYGAPPVFPVCGIGEIREYSELPDGCYNIVVQGLTRAYLLEELRSEPYRVARAEALGPTRASAQVLDALRAELAKQVRRIAPHLSGPAQNLETRLTADPGECADIVAGALIEDPDQRQELLEELDPSRRLSWLIAHLHGHAVRKLVPQRDTPENWN